MLRLLLPFRPVCLFLLSLSLLLSTACGPQPRDEVRLLVFSKTAGYRHASIAEGIALLQQIGQQEGWTVDTTEDASQFNQENLQRYSAVVFLSTTGDVLDHYQQADFERYIQAGGGYVGIHAASDTEYDWSWYGRLVGAYFKSHPNNPNVRSATMRIVNTDHPSTQFLAGRETWERTDEFYNFKDIFPEIVPLINVDETTYAGGENGDFHPMTWYHDYDGGRAWYTNFGHTAETFAEPDFIQLLTGGLSYAIGENLPVDYAKARSLRVPPAHRFLATPLLNNLEEPTELEILPDGRILFAQRRGKLMLYDPEQDTLQQAADLKVWTKFEDGLVGLALDPGFRRNRWVYLYYAPVGEEPKFNLSRFVFQGDTLVPGSEQLVLEVPVQRDTCCHTGGSIEFGPEGYLYLSTGDDTNPFNTRYAPIDERPGMEAFDAQRSSGNPSDLRGKVLRIQPLADGGYTVPEGNLFPRDGSQGRPEIYVMGCRNPYRLSIDAHTGYLYWGDVGPDGRVDSTLGPRGYDEVNQARQPGFFGWPYFIGNNYPYTAYRYEQAGLVQQASFDPQRPRNATRHNQGTRDLPPAQPAFIWYPYDASPDFPLLGEGGRNAMAGPVYHHADFAGAPSQFPRYYDGKLFFYDFMRDWVMLATMNVDGDLERIEPFLPKEQLGLSSPTDMQFGPDGALYVINYGTQWFRANADATLVRIDYSEANRPPRALATVDEPIGAAPHTVTLSGASSTDQDPQDQLSYRWIFPAGDELTGEEVSYTFETDGIYQIALEVSDQAGNQARTHVKVQVGNAPPQLSLALSGNEDFFWGGRAIAYRVEVSDQEDGSLAEGSIPAERVTITWNWDDSGFDPAQSALGHQALAQATAEAPGLMLINQHGCIACHGMAEKVIGPGYQQVAERYRDSANALDYLARKILRGGAGAWGEQAMPAMAQLSAGQARQIAKYILALGQEQAPGLPPAGRLSPNQHSGLGEGGTYTLRVSYQDQGGPAVGPLSRTLVHRWASPQLELEDYLDQERSSDVEAIRRAEARAANLRREGALYTYPVDLTGVSSVSLRYRSEVPGGAALQLRLEGPEGTLIAEHKLPDTRGQGDPYAIVRFPLPPTKGRHRLYAQVIEGESRNEEIGPVLLDWLYLQ